MIVVEKYKRKYFKAVCEMTDAEWDMGKTMSRTRTLWPTRYYFYWHFQEYKIYDYVLLDNGRCVGYIAIADLYKKVNIFKRLYYRLAMWWCRMMMTNRKGFDKFWHYYDFIPDWDQFDCDCELVHWIVDKKYRGNKNGKYLFTVALAQARALKCKNMGIYTDNTCSFWVYDLMGAERVLERDIDFSADGYRVGEPEHAIMFKYKIE